MIEVRVALIDQTTSPDHPAPIARHFIAPCRCRRRFLDAAGEMCTTCGRHTLGALLTAALAWYPSQDFDPVLRSYRNAETGLGA